ncbi:MAG: hypothetical protein WC069_06025, partial [Candidatus Shapirobacteria bacterium]
MAINLPIGTDPLSLPDHALSHRVFANDDAAPVQSVVVDSTGKVTISQDIIALSFITDGGLSSQFLKGDGSLDGSVYLTSLSGALLATGGVVGATSQYQQFTTGIQGGTGVTDILKLKGTSGNGTLTSPAIQALVGNNGATTAITVLNNGNVGVGTSTPSGQLSIIPSTNTATALFIQGLASQSGNLIDIKNSAGT